MSNPRFRTLHDAGKYAAALAYPEFIKHLTPKDFGAIDKYVLNEDWLEAAAEVSLWDGKISDLKRASTPPEDLKTANEWYQEWRKRSNVTILNPLGWSEFKNFDEVWMGAKITLREFVERLNNSLCYD